MCAPGCVNWWWRLDHVASRRELLKGALALPAAIAGCATPSPTSQGTARAVLDAVQSIDVHSLPRGPRRSCARRSRSTRGPSMPASSVARSSPAVGDGPTLAIRPNGAPYAAREPRPGALSRSCRRQLDVLDDHARTLRMRPVLRGPDLEAASAARERVAVMSVEGGDFLEGRLENVQVAYDRGVRSVQLVHYRVNELGDIQTEPPVPQGLTPFGREVIREMNRLGMLVDLAHAPLPVVRGALEASTRPMLVSPTNIADDTGSARFVSREHARLVASAGGVLARGPSPPVMPRSRPSSITSSAWSTPSASTTSPSAPIAAA
jgi:membrane dipeptidase